MNIKRLLLVFALSTITAMGLHGVVGAAPDCDESLDSGDCYDDLVRDCASYKIDQLCNGGQKIVSESETTCGGSGPSTVINCNTQTNPNALCYKSTSCDWDPSEESCVTSGMATDHYGKNSVAACSECET